MTMDSGEFEIRALRTLEDCRAVVQIQEEVWGRDGETVPASVLFVSAKRGGILLGASAISADHAGGAEPSTIAGFVWSMPGVRDDGKRTHWSHMLGVLPRHRQHRLAERLKWAQRERALVQGAELIEWTFDPLQAANAHFNLQVLGGLGAGYGVNIYGALNGPLHRGTPTDRLIVEWRIDAPHVRRRYEARQSIGSTRLMSARAAEIADAPPAIESVERDGWIQPGAVMKPTEGRRFLLPIPPRFLDMQQAANDVALAWRLAVRQVMTDALARGYRAVEFFLNRERGGGAYMFARDDSSP
jgi:predicted GNAT superfamily acetyltransferase